MQETLKKNDEIEVKIDRLGVNGEGIALFEGKVIFIPYALPDEEVKIHIINDKNSFLIAKMLDISHKSLKRCNAPCPFFQKCGGCDIEHIKYEYQLELKKQIVKDALLKYAKIDVDICDVVESPKQFRYRNKFAFPVQLDDGKVQIGMYKKNSHKIIPIDDCLLQSERTRDIIRLFKEYLIENDISVYDENSKKGEVKHIVVRENKDAFILTVVVTSEKFNNFEPLIRKLKTKFNNFGIVKNVNKLNNNVIFGNLDINIYGSNELEFNEFGIKYFVNNRSFLQVNDEIKHKIYEKILQLVDNREVVIDAYSGAGLLSSILAKKCERVIGIEIIKEATENAEKLKKINNLYNLTNINGDCSKIIPELIKNNKKISTIVLDPPRKGISQEVVESLIQAKPLKIIYLSCNPATLARDLNLLKNYYNIEMVEPYDMFPQTSNIETLVCLKLK